MDDVSQARRRYAMPSAVCSYCSGEPRVGADYQTGNVVTLFDDDLPPFRMPVVGPHARPAKHES